jgi:hypothetical protein
MGRRRVSTVVSITLPTCLAVALTGCSPDPRDGVGPLMPVPLPPNVTGTVVREGQPIAGLRVVLRPPDSGTSYDASTTDAGGRFWLHAPVGIWEIRASGVLDGDFASVTRDVLSDSGQIALPAFELSTQGANLEAPAAGAIVSPPTPGSPLLFAWRGPNRTALSARVQLYTENDVAVWFSRGAQDTSMLWNGLGTEGDYRGLLVPAGKYAWRVKFDFSDSSEARLRSIPLVIQ